MLYNGGRGHDACLSPDGFKRRQRPSLWGIAINMDAALARSSAASRRNPYPYLRARTICFLCDGKKPVGNIVCANCRNNLFGTGEDAEQTALKLEAADEVFAEHYVAEKRAKHLNTSERKEKVAEEKKGLISPTFIVIAVIITLAIIVMMYMGQPSKEAPKQPAPARSAFKAQAPLA